MIIFWTICAGLLAIALIFILPPLWERADKPAARDEDGSKEANLAVYRDQLAELEADLRNGILGEEQYHLERGEIERRLLEDVATRQSKPSRSATTGNSVPYAIALAIPLIVSSHW